MSPSGGGSGEETTYVYDNEAIILAYNAAGNIKAKYTHGPNIDEPLAIEKGNKTYYYHADGLGSIVALTREAGSKAQSYTYDSFGNITQKGNIDQPFTYTAREFDSETGLYYYRARYYDPKAGRFLQRDPIGFKSGDVNLYTYVGNNPVNRVDSDGLMGKKPPYDEVKEWAKKVKKWKDRFDKAKNLNDNCKCDLEDFNNCRKCCKAIAQSLPGLEKDPSGWWPPFDECMATMCMGLIK